AGTLAFIVLLMVTASGLVTWQWQRAVAALAQKEKALEDLQKEKKQRALAQVNALRDATPGAVPGILADLEANPTGVLPRLHELWQEGGEQSRRMRLALALLPVEPQTVRDELVAWMLNAEDPAEVLLVRDALLPLAAKLNDRLWQQA